MTDEYREKAAQCRRLAGAIMGDPAADRLLKMADEFEELALQAALGNLWSAQASQQPAHQRQQPAQQQQQPQQQPQAEDKSDPQ